MIKATGHSSARSQAICPPSLLSDLGAKHHYGKYRKISKDILNEVNFSCINIPNEYSPGANGSLIWQDICKKGRAKVLLKCRQVDTSLPPGKRKVHLQHPLCVEVWLEREQQVQVPTPIFQEQPAVKNQLHCGFHQRFCLIVVDCFIVGNDRQV